MANKIILDFEKNEITWDMPEVSGMEYNPKLSERKEAILEAMGYQLVDMRKEIEAINAFVNGEMSEEDLEKIFEEEEQGK